VCPTAVGADCIIMPGARVLANCQLHERVTVGANTVLGPATKVLRRATLNANVAVHSQTTSFE
jgi:UDP-3-O-[3-hydroxymyristoyl] glucosamine N-acyltransferase